MDWVFMYFCSDCNSLKILAKQSTMCLFEFVTKHDVSQLQYRSALRHIRNRDVRNFGGVGQRRIRAYLILNKKLDTLDRSGGSFLYNR